MMLGLHTEPGGGAPLSRGRMKRMTNLEFISRQKAMTKDSNRSPSRRGTAGHCGERIFDETNTG
jgi:hypothetical protein